MRKGSMGALTARPCADRGCLPTIGGQLCRAHPRNSIAPLARSSVALRISPTMKENLDPSSIVDISSATFVEVIGAAAVPMGCTHALRRARSAPPTRRSTPARLRWGAINVLCQRIASWWSRVQPSMQAGLGA